MDIPQCYALALGILLIVASLLWVIVNTLRFYESIHFLERVFHIQIHPCLGNTSWFRGAIILAFLGGNVFFMVVKVKDLPGLVRRSGLISTINLIPLSLGGHMNIIASRCGISLTTYTRTHRWLGRIAIVEGLIHVAATLSLRKPAQRARLDFAALIAAIAFLVILSSWLLRRSLYEAYIYLHLALAAVSIAAIYLHSPTAKAYLLVLICLQSLIALVRLGYVLYRKPLNQISIRKIKYVMQTTGSNTKDGDPNTKDGKMQKTDINTQDGIMQTAGANTGDGIQITDPNIVEVHVRLSRPWKPKAGQYVYLCVPGVSGSSFAQFHPFYVSWWYTVEKCEYIVLVIQAQRGFTRNLISHATDDFDHHHFKMGALIEGPYGKEPNLSSYGTVVLVATGIGITSQIAYVKRLLEGYKQWKANIKRIALFWQVESEPHTAWVSGIMNDLLEQDEGRILNIHLFVVGDFVSTKTCQGSYVQPGSRLHNTYTALDDSLIKSEIRPENGRTLVSLCANEEISSKIRKIVGETLGDSVHLEELDFRPADYSKRCVWGCLKPKRGSKKLEAENVGAVG